MPVPLVVKQAKPDKIVSIRTKLFAAPHSAAVSEKVSLNSPFLDASAVGEKIHGIIFIKDKEEMFEETVDDDDEAFSMMSDKLVGYGLV